MLLFPVVLASSCSVDGSHLPEQVTLSSDAAAGRTKDADSGRAADRGRSNSDLPDSAFGGDPSPTDGRVGREDAAFVDLRWSDGRLDGGGKEGGVFPTGTSGVDGRRGSSGQGGNSGKGGAFGSGGVTGAGGAARSGGATGSGGLTGRGGVVGSGGSIGSGGSTLGTGSGGATIGVGGAVGVGGVLGSGGVQSNGGNNGFGGTGPGSDLVLRYKFDEGSGTTLADSSGAAGGPRNATLATIGRGASADFSPNTQVGPYSLSLHPSTNGRNEGGGYATIPALASLAPQAVTIAVWVYLAVATDAQNEERIFDFGSGTLAAGNLYLTARAGGGAGNVAPLRFGIVAPGGTHASEQRIDTSFALNANEWHHVAVVLPSGSPFTGTLYVDGVAYGTNPNMTLHAADLGNTTNNWLGRAQSARVPFYDGLLDDFRVYGRALAAEEVAALFALH